MSFNYWEFQFKEPLEFARLMQTVPELRELTSSLAKFRHYLLTQNATDFDFKLMGFKIGYEQ